MGKEIIYDVYKDGVYIGDYTTKEMKEKFHMSPVCIRDAALEDRLIRKHYRIRAVDHKISKGSALLIDFDLTTRRILEKAGKA